MDQLLGSSRQDIYDRKLGPLKQSRFTHVSGALPRDAAAQHRRRQVRAGDPARGLRAVAARAAQLRPAPVHRQREFTVQTAVFGKGFQRCVRQR